MLRIKMLLMWSKGSLKDPRRPAKWSGGECEEFVSDFYWGRTVGMTLTADY